MRKFELSQLPFLQEVTFASLEEVNDFPHGWTSQFYALSDGQNSFHMRRTETPSMVVSTGNFDGPTLQLGEVPESMKTFALCLTKGAGVRWRGAEVSTVDIMAFGSDRELECTADSPVSICTLSISDSYLQRTLEALDLEVDFDLGGLLRLEHQSQERLISQLSDLVLLSDYANSVGGDAKDQLAQVEEELLRELALIVGGVPTGRLVNVKNGYNLVSRALEYIRYNANSPIRVTVVAAEVGVSVRSLEMHFKKYLSATPKQVINLVRMAAVRHRLLETSREQSSVTKIVYEFGYCHLSQFAGDYRRVYGELPSETLWRCG